MGDGVHGGHMPGARLGARAAADALFGVHPADAQVIGVDRAHGAGVAAGGVFALAAGVREVHPVVVGVQAVAVAAGIQVAGHLHAGNVAGAAAVVGQRAVDLAPLAAHAPVLVHHQQALGERPHPHLVLGHGFLGHAQHAEHGSGNGQPGQTLARQLQELAARVVLVQEALAILGFSHDRSPPHDMDRLEKRSRRAPPSGANKYPPDTKQAVGASNKRLPRVSFDGLLRKRQALPLPETLIGLGGRGGHPKLGACLNWFHYSISVHA